MKILLPILFLFNLILPGCALGAARPPIADPWQTVGTLDQTIPYQNLNQCDVRLVYWAVPNQARRVFNRKDYSEGGDPMGSENQVLVFQFDPASVSYLDNSGGVIPNGKGVSFLEAFLEKSASGAGSPNSIYISVTLSPSNQAFAGFSFWNDENFIEYWDWELNGEKFSLEKNCPNGI